MTSDYRMLRQGIASLGDFQKLEEEFQLKKAQAEQAAQLNALQGQKLQRELSAPDLESLAQQSLYAYHQGQPLTSEGKAAIETLATLKGSNVQYKPDEFGNVRAVSEPNPYQQFLGGQTAPSFGGDPMAASQNAIRQRQSEIGSNPYQGEIIPVSMTQADIEQQLQGTPVASQDGTDFSSAVSDSRYAPPKLDSMVANSPFGKKAVFEQQLKYLGDLKNPSTELGKMQKDEAMGLVPKGSTELLLKEKTRQTRKEALGLEKEEKAAREAAEQEKATKGVAEKKVKEALAILNKSFTSSGFPATMALNVVPGKSLPPDVLNSAYGTLKSNISLDTMMKLKEASSTGSTGFGALSAPELKILTDKIGELDAELPRAVQIENLKTIAQILKLDIPEFAGRQSTGDVQTLIDRYAD